MPPTVDDSVVHTEGLEDEARAFTGLDGCEHEGLGSQRDRLEAPVRHMDESLTNAGGESREDEVRRNGPFDVNTVSTVIRYSARHLPIALTSNRREFKYMTKKRDSWRLEIHSLVRASPARTT